MCAICSRRRRHFRTVLPDEDVEHRQNLAVVGHQRLPDEALPVWPLVARDQRLQHLQHLHDHPLLSRVQRSCAHATAPTPAVRTLKSTDEEKESRRGGGKKSDMAGSKMLVTVARIKQRNALMPGI